MDENAITTALNSSIKPIAFNTAIKSLISLSSIFHQAFGEYKTEGQEKDHG